MSKVSNRIIARAVADQLKDRVYDSKVLAATIHDKAWHIASTTSEQPSNVNDLVCELFDFASELDRVANGGGKVGGASLKEKAS